MNILRTAVRSVLRLIVLIPVGALIIGCSQASYRSDLVAYLQAEKQMRMRVKLEVALRDSLAVLRDAFALDPEIEFSRFQDHPESWIQLIEELRRAQ
jgi:hypothetical protein